MDEGKKPGKAKTNDIFGGKPNQPVCLHFTFFHGPCLFRTRLSAVTNLSADLLIFTRGVA